MRQAIPVARRHAAPERYKPFYPSGVEADSCDVRFATCQTLQRCGKPLHLCPARARVHLGGPAVREGDLPARRLPHMHAVGIEVLLPRKRPIHLREPLDVAHLRAKGGMQSRSKAM